MSNPVVVTPPAGGRIVVPPEDLAATKASGGVATPLVDLAQEEFTERRRQLAEDTSTADVVMSGIGDAFTLGLVRDTGEWADLVRSEKAGANFVGNAIGTALGLVVGGPVKIVAKGGEAAGRALARTVIKDVQKSIIGRGLTEAGAGAALTGAMSVGHQVGEAVFEDKAFSAAAVLDEASLGGIMGFGFGAAAGALGRLAGSGSRGSVRAQGGLVSDPGQAVGLHKAAVREYETTIDTVAKHLGGLSELKRFAKKGQLGPEWGRVMDNVSEDLIKVRTDALRNARNALDDLRGRDLKKALDGEPSDYLAWRRSNDRAAAAVKDLEDIARALDFERVASGRAPKGPMADVPTSPVPYQSLDDAAADLRSRTPRTEMVEAEAATTAVPAPVHVPDKFGMSPAPGHAPGQRPASALMGDAPTPGHPVTHGMPPAPGHPAGSPTSNLLAQRGTLADLDAAVGKIPMRADPDAALYNSGPIPTGAEIRATKKATASAEDLAANAKTGPVHRIPNDALDTTRIERLAPGNDAVRRTLDDWYAWSAGNQPGRPVAGSDKILAMVEDFHNSTGGRLHSVPDLGDIPTSTSQIGAAMDKVYGLRRTAKMAADESRGVASPLRKTVGDAIGGAALNAAARGVGIHWGLSLLAFSGRAASKAGDLVRTIAGAAEKFMSPTAIRSGVVASGNIAWTYSDKGPIEDPLERIQEIRFLAADPSVVEERIQEQMGDLGMTHPEYLAAMKQHAVAQVTALSVRAPAMFFNRMGEPVAPPAGKMRAFHEFENGINDLQSLLRAVAGGYITPPQADALRTGWGPVNVRITAQMLRDPDLVKKLTHGKKRVLEMLTGVPLTGATDPMFLMRQAEAWIPPEPAQPPGRPQAFNINPDGPQLPSQSNTGRAPGN